MMMSTNETMAESFTAQQLLPPHQELIHYRQSQFDELFDTLPDATATMLHGNYRGRLYAVKGLDSLPGPLRLLLMGILQAPLPVWTGKQFSSSSGANLWLSRKKPAAFGRYRYREETGHALQLDYDVPENPKALRPILGEVKATGQGLFLARMLYRRQSGPLTILYFTLSKPELS